MCFRAFVVSVISNVIFPLFSAAQNPPHIGEWLQGPVGNRHDVTPDAVTKGQFAINNQLVSSDATIFLACKSADTGSPALELRFMVPPFRSFNLSTVSKSALLYIDADKYPVSLESFPVQNMVLFVVLPGQPESKRMAFIEHNHTSTLSLDFQAAGQKASFITNLTEPVPPIATVLKACNVVLPPPPPPIPVATPTEMSKYTFMGIHLGMTAQQALSAEKAIAATPIKPGVGGGVDFDTSQFHFISVTADAAGLVSFYKVCGKSPNASSRSGPLYSASLKAFGPATGKSDAHTIHWDKSRGVDARYEWDGDEEPGGCLYVTKAVQ
jgi:hypothetical protein